MIIHEPIYGRFSLPDYLRGLTLDPAVRRLTQVRLINTPSPSIAALGDIRRYSHTLGVLALALRSPLNGFSEAERRAFYASVLLHDVGSPPFAHLLEYHLSERESDGWDHERMIGRVLWSHHAPEDRSHQIFGGRSTHIQKALEEGRIEFALVKQIVDFTHPLSKLIFGTLDLDNLDNVTRMAWGLGLLREPSFTIKLATTLAVNEAGELLLPRECEKEVCSWTEIRSRVYEVLLFSPDAMAAQAVLFDAVGKALDEGALSRDEWSETDEELLELLRKCPATKESIVKDFFGQIPAHAFTIRIKGTLASMGFLNRREAIHHVSDILKRSFPNRRTLSYVSVDSGTFAKRMQFRDPLNDEAWSIGERTQSVLFYGFVCRAANLVNNRCRSAVDDLLDSQHINGDDVIECRIGERAEDDGQRTFNFSPA